jgi:uncharacterized linocin/CFP29 family protein
MKPYLDLETGEAFMAVYKGKGDKEDPLNYEEVPVNNATLQYDEWRTLDDAVIKTARNRLVGFDDLRRNGLVYTLNNAMGTTVLTWEEVSDQLEAAVSIDPVKRTDGDLPDFDTAHIPIPVVHSDFHLSMRLLEESRMRGNPLNTTLAEMATRRVAEKLESMLFGASATIVYGGGTIHSLISFPNKTTINYDSAGNYWDDSDKTPAQIKEDVRAMKAAAIADKHYGPYMLYVPTEYETVLDDDYSISGASRLTIRERLLQIGGIQDIKVVDTLPDDNVVLVEMTSDTIDLIDGMPIQTVQWSTEGGFVENYKVMTIQVPRIKQDYNNASGVVVLKPS